MICDLIIIGDKRLKQVSQEVKNFDKDLEILLENMEETMYANRGIGLAAVQIGIMQRIFIVDIPEQTKGVMHFINPKIEKYSHDKISYTEGCLSIPGVNYEIERPKSIIISYQDIKGNNKKLQAKDLLAICVQHEYDHVNGILFIERANQKHHSKINQLLLNAQHSKFFI